MENYLLLLFGLILIGYALFKPTPYEWLMKKGKQAEGIIFSQEGESGFSLMDSRDTGSNINTKVTVRFTTEKQEWITGEIRQEFAFFFTNQYKPGEKIIVYYNPDRPSEFYVDTKQSEFAGRLIVILGGLVSIGIGLYRIFSGS